MVIIVRLQLCVRLGSIISLVRMEGHRQEQGLNVLAFAINTTKVTGAISLSNAKMAQAISHVSTVRPRTTFTNRIVSANVKPAGVEISVINVHVKMEEDQL